MSRVVVVGYGMAGARCAAELRALGSVKVTVLGAEQHQAYNRILLSSLLAGKVTEAGIALADGGVDAELGTEVTAIDTAGKTVTTADGELHDYDHLVLATGSHAWIPPLPGIDPDDLPDRVSVFRTLDDCRRILADAEGAERALVLGGGLLGLEAARGLAARGLAVEVVHPMGFLMERQLDNGASEVLVATLAGHGIGVHLEAMGASFAQTPDGVVLTLTDGRELRADLLVLACGVRPETSLARAAGLTVDRGVVVDDRMRTSDPDISAIGDCAQHREGLSGLVAPAWAQASVVARILTGTDPDAIYRAAPLITRLKATGIDLAAMGTLSGDDCSAHTEDLRFADPSRGTYARLRIRDGRVTGAVLLGDNPSVGQVIQLFDRGAQVPADRRALLLGRTLGGSDAVEAVTPALMPDAATVCQCNTVTKGAIIRAWQGGAHDIADVAACTRATTGCGSCVDAVGGILGWLATQGVAS
ncbi:assimilatory nitrate reductase electron transfer subunit [Allocatelliglobosispora scoriae]|uniref:Assimilatory nitrate reductase electron transfer subunit n=1 Tax=Allocatelliglobosispora scoriae TaxID=643052 RepID=A0A841BXL4_9ACTN|nr:FAD-dependent oxidoreductase [Allocatelliglobosispora scoriae]MBB5871512.1 assimilatory nitrate reductase electron transfer subunit [Allocatelliglobosispora scoriae]